MNDKKNKTLKTLQITIVDDSYTHYIYFVCVSRKRNIQSKKNSDFANINTCIGLSFRVIRYFQQNFRGKNQYIPE
jgi:hypothetical protein